MAVAVGAQFKRVQVQFLAALGDPKATRGINAQVPYSLHSTFHEEDLHGALTLAKIILRRGSTAALRFHNFHVIYR